MKKVVISIIVPVYNTENYLENCLNSLVGQTYKNIEIILVDDGSNDSSGAICDNFAEMDSRVHVFHRTNSGVSAARNFGIDKASGEYVMFVDSDDWLDTKACECLYHAAEENKKPDYIICGNYNVATAGNTPRSLFKGEYFFEKKEYRDEILVSTLGLVGNKLKNPAKLDKLTPVWARLYRRDIIVNNNIQFIDLNKLPSECLQFNFEFCVFAETALYVDQALYYYRRNTQFSVTKPFRENLWKKWDWWITYMNGYISVNCDFSDIWSAFYSRICCSVIPLGGNALKLRDYKRIKSEVKNFLNKEIFTKAFNHFDDSRCVFYWRLFFYAARRKRVSLFIALTWCMRTILSLRKS